MKIKNYKLVYDPDHGDYNVYTDDIESTDRNSNGCNLGFVYLKLSVGWLAVLRNLTKDISAEYNHYDWCPYAPDSICPSSKTKEKAAKRLVKYQNKILKKTTREN